MFWYLGSLPVVPGKQWQCCLGQLCGRLLISPIRADVDECSLEYGPCSQLCTNTPGAFSCACLQGYTLRHGTACEVTGRGGGEPCLDKGWAVSPPAMSLVNE